MKNILSTFETNINSNRLSHLYLFCGNGLESDIELVFQIAYMIIKKTNDDPNLLNKMRNGTFLNYCEISSDGEIKKEAILALQKEFAKTSLIDGNRVFFIKQAQKLNMHSANSLLKFLEDPLGNNTIGLLLTSSIDQVLPTIRSRAQIINLNITNDFYQKLIDEGILVVDSFALSLVTDDVNVAKDLANQEPFRAMMRLVTALLQALKTGKKIPVATIILEKKILIANKAMLVLMTKLLMALMLDAIKVSKGIKPWLLCYQDDIESINKKVKPIQVKLIFDVLQEMEKRLNAHVNLSFQYDDLFVQIERILQ